MLRSKVGIAFLVFAAIVVFAYPASACEKCVNASTPGWKMCESGHASGYQYCYGGFGVPCSYGGDCGTGGGGTPPIENPELWLRPPCLLCADEKPAQGFVLRTDRTVTAGATQPASPDVTSASTVSRIEPDRKATPADRD